MRLINFGVFYAKIFMVKQKNSIIIDQNEFCDIYYDGRIQLAKIFQFNMIQDRSPNETLNLSEFYISHWTYLHGLRQYYQNFMDACIEKYPDYKLLVRSAPNTNIIKYTQARRNGSHIQEIQANFIEYNKQRQTLIFQNEKSFPIKCMLMGCSNKGPQALGQFGQGMKISMIVLLKAQMDIKIESGDIIYYPTLAKWDHNEFYKGQYDHRVVYVKYQQNTKFMEKTRVTISNLSAACFEDFRYLALPLLDQTIFQTLKCGKSTLIFTEDQKLKGKVYKKGVRLDLRQPSQIQESRRLFRYYAYDFEEIEVGRDRDCANNVWDLYNLQSKVHFDVCCKNFDEQFKSRYPEFREKLRQHSQVIYQYLCKDNVQTHYFHVHSKNRKDVCDIFYKKFLLQHNKTQLYPSYAPAIVSNIHQKMHKYGLNQQFYPIKSISWQLWHTLAHSSFYTTIDAKIQKNILSVPGRELNTKQSAALNPIKQKIGDLFAEINQFQFMVKEFTGLVCYKENKIIYIGAQEVSNIEKVKRQLTKMILAV